MSSTALFAISTVIWGSTWLAITFQLGVVPPEVSVVYRFALAALLLGAWCVATGRSIAFAPRVHAWLAFWGAMMFGFNYVAVYYAEQHVSSGFVAVIFSTMVFMSPLGMRVFFGEALTARMFVAATLGVVGVALMFLPELRSAGGGGFAAAGTLWALAGTAIATGGNLAAVRNHAWGLPLLPATAWGMAWGAASAAAIALVQGVEWTFDARMPYVLSLLYLTVFGSVAAFTAYLLLIRQVGAQPAAYVGVATPVIAMALSTIFEGYRWTPTAFAGVALAIAGNVMALRSGRK